MVAPHHVIHARVDGHGRIVIPAELRERLGIEPGHRVALSLDDGVITIVTADEAARRLRETVAKYVVSDRSLVDELIAERRAEAEREARE
jgi:AbrB family looped-hinge helix DNA binding protein